MFYMVHDLPQDDTDRTQNSRQYHNQVLRRRHYFCLVLCRSEGLPALLLLRLGAGPAGAFGMLAWLS